MISQRARQLRESFEDLAALQAVVDGLDRIAAATESTEDPRIADLRRFLHEADARLEAEASGA